MSLLSGSAAWIIYRFRGPLPDTYREEFQEGILKHRHVEQLEIHTKAANVGWVAVNDPTDNTLYGDTWCYDDVIVLGVRTDKKTLNGKMLEALLEREVEKIRRERKLASIGKNHRKEIKQALEESLLKKQTPSLKMGEMVMDLESVAESGDVDIYIFGTSAPSFTMFRESFCDIRPHLDRYGDWLLDGGWTEGQICEGLTRIYGSGHQTSLLREDDRHPDLFIGHYSEIGADFLTWLWCSIDTAGGTYLYLKDSFGDRWEVWLESKIVLTDDKHKVSLNGESMGEMPEGIDALGADRRPCELQLGIRRGDVEWKMTVAHKLYSTVIKGCKLQKAIGSSDDDLGGAIYDRFGQVRRLQTLIRQLFCTFFAERTAGDFDARISTWVGAQQSEHRQASLDKEMERSLPAKMTEPGPIEEAIARAAAPIEGEEKREHIATLKMGDGTTGRLEKVTRKKKEPAAEKAAKPPPPPSTSCIGFQGACTAKVTHQSQDGRFLACGSHKGDDFTPIETSSS